MALPLSRRDFLAASSLACGSFVARPALAFAADSPYLQTIGLQLYTVRDQMAADEGATLQAIAKAGYKQVELMSIAGDGPRIANKARELGMKVTSGFCDFKTFTTDSGEGAATAEQLIRDAEKLKLEHVVFGYVPKGSRETASQYKAMAARCNAAAPRFRDAGIQLCYHHHSFEFARLDDGKTGFDYFVELFEPAMKFEIDVFWAEIGGRDPITLLRKLNGRVSQVHLKDLQPGIATQYDEGQVPKDAFQELGDGVIDMTAVLQVSHEIGVVQCHVEQDQSPAPLDSIVQSIDYLRQGAASRK